MKTYITKINDQYYAFAGDTNKDQVYSIGTDNPDKTSGGERWVARWNESGIKYVSSASPSRDAARKKAQRHGEYFGEV